MITILLTVSVAAALIGILAQGFALARAGRRQTRLAEQLESSQQRIHALEQELGALCSASVGAGEHVVTLEQQVGRIVERQNLLELRASSDRPYTQASQLIHKGADIEELVGTCGLTRGEAELLLMMQRGAA